MQGGKKSVFLEMSYLVNIVMRQFKGPEVKRHIYPSDGVMRTVTVSLEVRKLPFQRNSGTPDLEVAFVGSKNISVEKSEHDAVMKLASYLIENYRVQIADWNYEKLSLTKEKLLQIDNNVKLIVVNINDMVGKLKVSVSMLSNLQSAFSVSETVLKNAVSGKLNTIKCMVEADLEHISHWMEDTRTEYVQCSESINSTHIAEV
jgi:hypothetical protein